jgi:hypothetical protein
MGGQFLSSTAGFFLRKSESHVARIPGLSSHMLLAMFEDNLDSSLVSTASDLSICKHRVFYPAPPNLTASTDEKVYVKPNISADTTECPIRGIAVNPWKYPTIR